jgi:CxxC motif-containing protein (DUF1111 family)
MKRPTSSAGKLWLRGLASVGVVALALGADRVVHATGDALGERTGGATTVDASGKNAFSFPAANLSDEERTRFAIGNSFFKRNWVQAPASTTARDGLGPHFIARSCAGCHVQDGRGQPPALLKTMRDGLPHEPAIALLVRLSVAGTDAHGGPKPHPVYGDQINNAAVLDVKPEGQPRISWQTMRGRYADGTPYTLSKPRYEIVQLAYGPLGADVMMSPRIAPQIAGVGLIDAISPADIEANAVAQASRSGPIKGRVNRVWDAYAQEMLVGRFGWKANVASLAHQTASAFNGDIGITSMRFSSETCTTAQTDCRAAPSGGGGGKPGPAAEPEVDEKTLEDVIFYQATLAPAARRNASDIAVLRGQKLFQDAQCAACHKPSYVTTSGVLAEKFPRLSSPALNKQTIWPYSDFLLHDMGAELADGRPDFLATGREWKTPPLWGIGLIGDVNGHTRLLHDGRARNVAEAILWHGGTAQSSREFFRKLNAQERRDLVKFVESL